MNTLDYIPRKIILVFIYKNGYKKIKNQIIFLLLRFMWIPN
jgi:hypothetical protein